MHLIALDCDNKIACGKANAFRNAKRIPDEISCVHNVQVHIYAMHVYDRLLHNIPFSEFESESKKNKISAFIYGNFEGLFYRNVNDFRTTNAYLFMHYVDKALMWSVNEFFKFLIALRTHSIFVFVAGNMSIFELCTNKMNR